MIRLAMNRRAVRIYNLAAKLKVDSKELVNACAKAGIGGKGSALSSLTVEEAQKVTQFLKDNGGENRRRQ